MRRVRASIKVGRRGKRNKDTKGLQGGGALRGARLRPGKGQESTLLEKQELHQSSWVERHSQGVRAGPQEGQGCPQAPWDTNRHLRPGESAPSSLKGCSGHTAGTRSSSEGLSRRLRGEGAARPGARTQQRRPEGTGRREHSPGSGLPAGQGEARRAQDSKYAPAPS